MPVSRLRSSPALRRDAALAGMAAVAPTLLMVAPFGVLSGAIFAESGLGLIETFLFSFGVYAGASQLATLELMRDGASWAVIVATGLAINLRFTMFAATLAPWWRGGSVAARAGLGYLNIDNMLALAVARYRARPEDSVGERMAYYAGGACLSTLVWQAATLFGYFAGSAAPAWLQLDYAAPIAFVAIAMPLLVDRPSWAAAATAAAAAVLARDLPLNLGVIVATLAGVAAGLAAEGLGPRGRGAPLDGARP